MGYSRYCKTYMYIVYFGVGTKEYIYTEQCAALLEAEKSKRLDIQSNVFSEESWWSHECAFLLIWFENTAKADATRMESIRMFYHCDRIWPACIAACILNFRCGIQASLSKFPDRFIVLEALRNRHPCHIQRRASVRIAFLHMAVLPY